MKKFIENNKVLTAKQVAEEFFQGQFNYQGVLRLTREGKLPAIKIGKSYLFLQSELERWVEKNFNTPAWNAIKC